jgi:Spy/CpxP family protein refolding chaperone
MTFWACGLAVEISMMMTSNKGSYRRLQMKLKLMPMLVGGVAALALIATPFVLKAHANTSEQPLLAQAQRQSQGRYAGLDLTQEQQDKIAQIRRETRSQIEALLTPEQQEQLKALRQNNRQQQREAFRAAREAVNLSDTQIAQMREIRKSARTEMQAILTPQQQEQLRQNMQERRQQRNSN